MSFLRPYGRLVSGLVTLTNGAPGPVVIITPGADEFVDVYSVTLSTNDGTLQQVTVDDGANPIGTYFVGTGAPNTGNVLDTCAVPRRGRKGGAIRATAGAVTTAKTITVKVVGLISKT